MAPWLSHGDVYVLLPASAAPRWQGAVGTHDDDLIDQQTELAST